MIFDIIVGNPPYQGNWDPLHIQITKSIYDNNMGVSSVMCLINPTTVVDNMNTNDVHYKKLFEKYSHIRLSGFVYEPSFKNTFDSVKIGKGVGIFTYRKNGCHNLFDGWSSIIRFGDSHSKNSSIIDKINKHEKIDLKDRVFFLSLADIGEPMRTKKISSFQKGFYCLCSVHRGHTDDNGDFMWDWPTLLTKENLISHESITNGQWCVFRFGDRKKCVDFIKWLNTDFVQFIILFYKLSPKNPKILLKTIPTPPDSGDFSDSFVMDEFGISEEDIMHIHNTMKMFGWKNKFGMDEESLMKRIDSMNNLYLEIK